MRKVFPERCPSCDCGFYKKVGDEDGYSEILRYYCVFDIKYKEWIQVRICLECWQDIEIDYDNSLLGSGYLDEYVENRYYMKKRNGWSFPDSEVIYEKIRNLVV